MLCLISTHFNDGGRQAGSAYSEPKTILTFQFTFKRKHQTEQDEGRFSVNKLQNGQMFRLAYPTKILAIKTKKNCSEDRKAFKIPAAGR